MHPTQTRRCQIAALALAAGLLALSGCAKPANDRLRLGACEVLPAFQTHPHALPPAGPSVTGLDRSGWAPIAYAVPVHGTAHQPTYAPSHFELDTLPRQRGEFPTVESALDLGEPDLGQEASLTFRNQLWALFDAALIVPRFVRRPSCATDWSPGITYDRVPGAVAWTPTCCTPDAPSCCEAEAPAATGAPAE